MMIKRSTVVGILESVSQVGQEDPLWRESAGPLVATVSSDNASQRRPIGGTIVHW